MDHPVNTTIYAGKKRNQIAYPLGGMGAGMLCIGGAAVFLGYPKLWGSRGELQPMRDWPTTTSAEDDSFTLTEWPADLRQISAFHSGYAAGRTPIAGDPAEAQPFTLVLSKGGSVRGRITLDGQPLEEAEATVAAVLRGANETFGSVSVSTVGRGGVYRLRAVPPGEVMLKCFLSHDALPPGTDH